MATGETGDRALEAAMDWLLEIQAAPDDDALRARFEAWLAADPAHPPAWDRARRAWDIVDQVPPVHVAMPEETARRRPSPRFRPYRTGLAAAAMAACLALMFGPSILLELRADHATATGELRTVTLEDGSRVELGPRSAIGTDYAEDRRHVTLLAGEAWFDVKSDPGRPFTVRSAGVDTTVLGTAFEVRLAPRAATVSVARGLVGVRADLGDGHVDTRLQPGESVTVALETGAATRAAMPLDAVASWREGLLYADGVTLAEMVERIRHYQRGWIVVADDRLAERRVTGLYDARDPDQALLALVQASGGRVRHITPLLTILSAE